MWSDRSGRIDHDGPELLWEQVRDDLRTLIENGEMARGAKLPGEIELGELYGVSRVTIRRAIRELTGEGMVTITTGKGTFVSRTPPTG